MEELLSGSNLTNQLIAKFRSPSYRPPMLPQVAMQVWQLSQQPDVDIDRLRVLLESKTRSWPAR